MQKEKLTRKKQNTDFLSVRLTSIFLDTRGNFFYQLKVKNCYPAPPAALAPLDYIIIPNLKELHGGISISNYEEVTAEIFEYFEDFF